MACSGKRMSVSVLLLLCLCLSASSTLAQDHQIHDCIFQAPTGARYDLTPLRDVSTDFEVAGRVFFSVCRTTDKKCASVQSTVARENTTETGSTCTVLGMLETMSMELLSPAIGDGILLQYHVPADNFSSMIELHCDPSSVDGAESITLLKEDPSFVHLHFDTPFACAIPKHDVSSWGLLFCLILIGLVFGYCVLGALYKYKRYGATGTDAIPHLSFWENLCGLVGEGIRFTVDKVRGLFKPCFGKKRSSRYGKSTAVLDTQGPSLLDTHPQTALLDVDEEAHIRDSQSHSTNTGEYFRVFD